MREIKFRGRRLDNKEWVYGYFYNMPIRNIVASFILTNDFSEEFEHGTRDYDLAFNLWKDLFPINKETLGQFTGLRDRNGTPIYEGDILRYPAKDTFKEKNFVSFEVFWHENDCAANHVGWQMNRHHFHGSVCGTSDISTFLPKYTEKMVIIGNIHDNPELLK